MFNNIEFPIDIEAEPVGTRDGRDAAAAGTGWGMSRHGCEALDLF